MKTSNNPSETVPSQSMTSTSAARFRSPKCEQPILVGEGPLRDALIWASLDGSVGTISYECVTFSSPLRRVEFAVLDDTKVLDIFDKGDAELRRRDEQAWRAYGWTPLTFSPADIARDQRFVNARLIWRHAQAHVPFAVRLQVVGALEDGPLHLGELLKSILADRDPLPAIFAMACTGHLTIDLDGALGSDTRVGGK